MTTPRVGYGEGTLEHSESQRRGFDSRPIHVVFTKGVKDAAALAMFSMSSASMRMLEDR